MTMLKQPGGRRERGNFSPYRENPKNREKCDELEECGGNESDAGKGMECREGLQATDSTCYSPLCSCADAKALGSQAGLL